MDGLLVAVMNDKIIGQFGLIPVKIKAGYKELDAQWACDLMVDSSIRQMGIGSMLLAVSMERSIVSLGSEPSPAADTAMARIGFSPLQGPLQMVLPLQVGHVLGWKLQGHWRPLLKPAAALLQPLWGFRTRRLSRYKTAGVTVGSLEDLIPRVQKRQESITLPYVLHDEAFLRWRFSSPIPAPIQILLSQEGGFATCEATPSYFYVYDWHASSSSETSALFARITTLALKAGSQTILVYANNVREKDLLRDFGFLAQRSRVKVIVHPRFALPPDQDGFHYRIYDSDGNL